MTAPRIVGLRAAGTDRGGRHPHRSVGAGASGPDDDAPYLSAQPLPAGHVALSPEPDRLLAGSHAGEYPGAQCRRRAETMGPASTRLTTD